MNPALKSGGPKETLRAVQFYKNKKNHSKAFSFKVYSHETVKEALEELFGGKCAYCESDYSVVSPCDVEHWRPKGEVETESSKKIKPGYYWLAAKWENLLPSCTDCNRRRYQKVGLGNGDRVLLGKQNSFPLEPGSHRATKPDEERLEKPLLLHPCVDQPPKYLRFDKKDGVVLPRGKDLGGGKARAEASIKIYALNRSRLVMARKKVLLRIHKQIKRVQCAAQRVKRASTKRIRIEEQETYEDEMKELLAFTDSKEPYALMARQIVATFVSSRISGIR